MRINLSMHGISRRKAWLIDLQRKFAEAHDMKYGMVVQSYLASPNGAKSFAGWLSDVGFNVRFWCIEPLVSYDSMGRKQTDNVGFGLDFDDKCPMLTEVRLKA